MWLLFKRLTDSSRQSAVLVCKFVNYRRWTVDRNILMLGLLMIFNIHSFSKPTTSNINPIFRDSVLKNRMDSAKWNAIIHKTNIYRSANQNSIIQKQKHIDKSSVFLYISAVILILLLLMRLLFDDFFFSVLEGILSFKKFLVFYQSKKYDSLAAIILVYMLSIFIFSFTIYIGLKHFLKNNFTVFEALSFINILLVLTLFFTVKNIIEFIFNWVINTQQIYKAFFLQNLFIEFILSIVLLLLLLIYVYGTFAYSNFAAILSVLSFVLYMVFNTIRSYQLIGNMHISYKLHFFLYICAFKIMPILLLAKYVLNIVVA